jgi:hypothetical protein
MSIPVILSVVASMQTALQAIATASGYYNDVKPTSVVLDAPTSLSAVSPTEVPYFVLGHLVDPVNRDWHRSRGGTLGAIQDRWRITVEARVDANGTTTSRKRTALAQLEADIEKALTVDLFRGGLAEYTFVMQATGSMGLGNQNITYLSVPVDVLISRPYAQP